MISRIDNIDNWTKKLRRLAPISSIATEIVRFDTQKLENPEINGVEYQQGELHGFTVKEYLLFKYGHKCAYCDAHNTPLEVEHIVPRSKVELIEYLTLLLHALHAIVRNQTSIDVFLKKKPNVLEKIKKQLKKPLADTASLNSIRFAIGERLKKFDLPVFFGSGCRTKFNRMKQNYQKDHWIDAACVGESGSQVSIPKTIKPLTIKATGRGTRQMCRVNKHGFPRTSAKSCKVFKGFSTGDMVKAVVPKGKYTGTHIGRVSIRSTGSFDIKVSDNTITVNYKYCTLLQKADGYTYSS